MAELAGIVAVVVSVVLAGYAPVASQARRMFTSPRAVQAVNRTAGLAMAGAAAAYTALTERRYGKCSRTGSTPLPCNASKKIPLLHGASKNTSASANVISTRGRPDGDAVVVPQRGVRRKRGTVPCRRHRSRHNAGKQLLLFCRSPDGR